MSNVGAWFVARPAARWRARAAIGLWALVAIAAFVLTATAAAVGGDAWTIGFLALVSGMLLVYGAGLVVAEGPMALQAETLWIGPDGVWDRRVGPAPTPWPEIASIDGPTSKKINKRLTILGLALGVEKADRFRRAPGLTSVYRKDMKDEDPNLIFVRIDDLDAAPEAVAAAVARWRPRN